MFKQYMQKIKQNMISNIQLWMHIVLSNLFFYPQSIFLHNFKQICDEILCFQNIRFISCMYLSGLTTDLLRFKYNLSHIPLGLYSSFDISRAGT